MYRRRLRAQRPAAGAAGPADQHVRLEHRERTRTGIMPHPFPGFTISPVHLRPDGPRHGAAEEPRSAGAAGDPVQLPEDRLRPPGADLRHADLPQDRARSRRCSPMSSRRSLPGPQRQTDERARAPTSARAASPTCIRSAPAAWAARRRGGRSAAAGARHRRAAGGGRLDHAAIVGRQHQRAVDHDRREVRGHGARGRALRRAKTLVAETLVAVWRSPAIGHRKRRRRGLEVCDRQQVHGANPWKRCRQG